MGLIFVRGLAWQYTAETTAIVIVEMIMAYLVQDEVMGTTKALLILFIFPCSMLLVAFMEHMGFD
jgi:predicted metalloprotease